MQPGKIIAGIIFYSVTSALLALALSYHHLTRRFVDDVMTHGSRVPQGDQVYAWQNHGTIYLDYPTAILAHNMFISWMAVVFFLGMFVSIFGYALGFRFPDKSDLMRRG